MFSSSLHLDAQVLVIHTWEVHEDVHVVSGIPMNVTCMQMKGAEIINQVTSLFPGCDSSWVSVLSESALYSSRRFVCSSTCSVL